MTTYLDSDGNPHRRPAGVPAQWRIGGYAIAERDGRLLMVEPTWATGWTWDLPGGGIHLIPEETILDGIVRELYEETGFHFTPDPATLTQVGDYFHQSRSDGFVRMVTFVVRGTPGEGPEPAWNPLEGEIVRVAWIDPSVLLREEVHWHHWEALAKLGLVEERES